MPDYSAREIMELATNGGRLPLWLVSAIAWHESRWNPAEVTGQHVGLFQLAPSVVRDWTDAGGPDGDRADPQWNARVAGWALTELAASLRSQIAQNNIKALTWEELGPLVYWGWLAGTSDVPRTVWSWARWLGERTKAARSVIPGVRLVQEVQERLAPGAALWRRLEDADRRERWRPTVIRQALVDTIITPTLTRDFVRSEPKAKHAELVREWASLADWDAIDRFVERRHGRKRGTPLAGPVAAGTAILLLVVLALLALRR
jgi:hypothetical protein